jgi:hypothetical protein
MRIISRIRISTPIVVFDLLVPRPMVQLPLKATRDVDLVDWNDDFSQSFYQVQNCTRGFHIWYLVHGLFVVLLREGPG